MWMWWVLFKELPTIEARLEAGVPTRVPARRVGR